MNMHKNKIILISILLKTIYFKFLILNHNHINIKIIINNYLQLVIIKNQNFLLV